MNIIILLTVPGAVDNLEVLVLNDETFHISWDPPLSPNGVVTGYQVVVTNEMNSRERSWTVVAANVTELNTTSGIRTFKNTIL